MVKSSISIKLFLSLFGLTGVILLATIGLARWSFNYGFNDYLDSLQQEMLQDVADELVVYYNANGNTWDAATNQVLGNIIQNNVFELGHSEFLIHENAQSLMRPMEGEKVLGADNKANFQLNSVDVNEANNVNSAELIGSINRTNKAPVASFDFPPAMSMGVRPFTPPPPKNKLDTGRRAIVLFDANAKRVAGPPSVLNIDDYLSYSIVIDKKVVGELRTPRRRGYQSATENAFSTQQKFASSIIILLSLILAAIASWLLSRMMLTPIVKLKDGIKMLADGNYGNQLDVNREDELGLLMKDVNKLGTSLEKNRTSRKNWLADIAHELRTPVTILNGEIEAIKDGVRPLDIKSVDSLGHEVGRLRHLIDDLFELSLSEIGGLRYTFSHLDFTNFLTTVIDASDNRILEKGLKLDLNIESNLYMNADSKRVEQLFINLINNSIAYTDAPGLIKMSASSTTNDIFVNIEDSSPGLDHDSLSEIFEPLFRDEKSRDRREGGAGLGLAICRNIVHAHDGDISATGSDLGGVAIMMQFPKI